MFTARVAAGESGPVIVLSGEVDLTCAAQLSALITAQLSGGTRQLTVDVSGLWFADLAAIRELVLAARTLRERGGSMVLLSPQRAVARVLALTGAEQMFTIRGETHAQPEREAGDPRPAGPARPVRMLSPLRTWFSRHRWTDAAAASPSPLHRAAAGDQ